MGGFNSYNSSTLNQMVVEVEVEALFLQLVVEVVVEALFLQLVVGVVVEVL
jgi:hypothetical protein